ncbi:MAG: phosphate ABC transporter, permease protein PstA, partial [Candidatus Fonsibacter sp.]|nr:phosphate ABC transporter, permease protein PstA [Candidatus Fonsibacter sp.]
MNQQVNRLKRQDSFFWFVGLVTLVFALVTLLSLIV